LDLELGSEFWNQFRVPSSWYKSLVKVDRLLPHILMTVCEGIYCGPAIFNEPFLMALPSLL